MKYAYHPLLPTVLSSWANHIVLRGLTCLPDKNDTIALPIPESKTTIYCSLADVREEMKRRNLTVNYLNEVQG